MKKWDCNKLINGTRITTILLVFLIAVLHIRIDEMSSMSIYSVLWGMLLLLTLQGLMIDAIIKKLKTK